MKKQTNDMAALVTELAGLLKQLADLQTLVNTAVRDKLEAMRRADVNEIAKRSRREADLSAQIIEVDRTRRGVVTRICAALGIAATEGGREITLRSLLQRLNATDREKLSALANVLRDRMLTTAESNRVVEIVCHEMMSHFKAVFSAMTNAAAERGIYGEKGGRPPSGEPLVLDAVG